MLQLNVGLERVRKRERKIEGKGEEERKEG